MVLVDRSCDHQTWAAFHVFSYFQFHFSNEKLIHFSLSSTLAWCPNKSFVSETRKTTQRTTSRRFKLWSSNTPSKTVRNDLETSNPPKAHFGFFYQNDINIGLRVKQRNFVFLLFFQSMWWLVGATLCAKHFFEPIY